MGNLLSLVEEFKSSEGRKDSRKCREIVEIIRINYPKAEKIIKEMELRCSKLDED